MLEELKNMTFTFCSLRNVVKRASFQTWQMANLYYLGCRKNISYSAHYAHVAAPVLENSEMVDSYFYKETGVARDRRDDSSQQYSINSNIVLYRVLVHNR